MSKNLRRALDPVGTVIAKKGVDKGADPFDIYGYTGERQKELDAAMKAVPGASAAERVKTEQFADREGELRQSAAAAGATRIENDYDLLGRPRRAKARAASRVLLGE